MKDLLPDAPEDHAFKGQHGATWTVGNWRCRNFHGFFQSREIGARNWCFQIHGFGEADCDVMAINERGEMIRREVPIDSANRITIMGRKYGRSYWSH